MTTDKIDRKLSTATGMLIVVASMIGTGVFTTTGFLIRDLSSPVAILAAWLLGGLFALTGALSYGELVTALPDNGGEYQLLSKIYNPATGFIAGWLSLIVGFSAPVAAASLAFGHYICAITPLSSPVTGAVALLTALSILHGGWLVASKNIQNIFTVIKILLIIIFIFFGFMHGNWTYLKDDSPHQILNSVFSPGFAIGLIYISFAYSGWNGAAYIAGEIKNPSRSLPAALLGGTAFVILLYMGLNIIFLISAPRQQLSGVLEIGHVAALNIFGPKAGLWLSGIISAALLSSVSAMIMVGPRVYEKMGRDYSKLSFLTYRTSKGGPAAAVAMQYIISLIMIFTAAFETLLTYIGYLLSLSAGITVAGLIVLRKKNPQMNHHTGIRTSLSIPLLFIGLCIWMVVHTVFHKPFVLMTGTLTIAAGLIVYLFVKSSKNS